MTFMDYLNLITYIASIIGGIFVIYKYRYEKPKSNIVYGYVLLFSGILLITIRFL